MELNRTSLVFLFIWDKVGQVYINTELGHLTLAFLGRTANILLPPHLVQLLSLVL